MVHFTPGRVAIAALFPLLAMVCASGSAGPPPTCQPAWQVVSSPNPTTQSY